MRQECATLYTIARFGNYDFATDLMDVTALQRTFTLFSVF